MFEISIHTYTQCVHKYILVYIHINIILVEVRPHKVLSCVYKRKHDLSSKSKSKFLLLVITKYIKTILVREFEHVLNDYIESHKCTWHFL